MAEYSSANRGSCNVLIVVLGLEVGLRHWGSRSSRGVDLESQVVLRVGVVRGLSQDSGRRNIAIRRRCQGPVDAEG